MQRRHNQFTLQFTLQFIRPFTKRHLGVALVAASLLSVAGIMALNAIRQHTQIGPAQKLALIGCVLVAALGTTLIPLGSRLLVGDAAPVAEPGPDTKRGLWLRRLVLGVALALMIGHFAVYVNYALSLAGFPFDYDQGEGFELNDTVLFSQGQWPYRDNTVYPFYASNYPPLYHVILVPFVWLFGPAYWYGRLAGFAATLITAGAIGYAVYRATRHRPVAVLSGLAFLASNYVYHIGPLFRQHSTMVMFETLAVVTLAGLSSADAPPSQRRKLIVGLAFLLAAGYTKQMAVATVGAIFLYLLLRWPRRAIAWGTLFGGIAGLIFVWINASTAGQWWLNIITANVNQYILSQFSGLLRQFVSLHGALLALAGLLLLYELYADRLSLYFFWFAAGAGTAVLAGKWGAGDSYFATLIAATCILAGIFTGRCLNRQWCIPADVGAPLAELLSDVLTPALGVLACGLFALYALAVIHVPLDGPVFSTVANLLNLRSNTKFANFYDSAGWTMGYATIGQIPTAEDVANGWRIVAAAQNDGKPILSEEAGFSFRMNQPVVTNPTQLLNLFQNGHYDPANLVRMIDEQAFGAVIFRARFYPQPVLDAVDRAYKVKDTIPMNGYEYRVLLPDPAWAERRAAR